MLDATFDPFDPRGWSPESDLCFSAQVSDGSPTGRAAARGPGALGNKGRYVVPVSEGWQNDWKERQSHLQRVAADLLFYTKVATCGQGVGRSYEHRGGHTKGVMVRRYQDRTYAANVISCHLTHYCPHCKRVHSEHKRQVLAEIIDEWISEGGLVAMVTLTQGHTRFETLDENLQSLRTRRQTLFSGGGKQMKALNAFGVQGGYVALEGTHSFANGWHPHEHILIFFAPGTTDVQIARFKREYAAKWRAMTRKDGRNASDNAFNFKMADTGTNAAGYVVKNGVDYEMTKSNLKIGKGGSRTPEGILLDYAISGNERDAALYREWADTMHGKKQLSPFGEMRKRFKNRFNEKIEESDLPGAINETEITDCFFVEEATWKEIHRKGGAQDLLNAFDVGGMPAVLAVAASYGVIGGIHPPEAARKVRFQKRQTKGDKEDV